jgi:hypothetical protein
VVCHTTQIVSLLLYAGCLEGKYKKPKGLCKTNEEKNDKRRRL